MALTAKWARGGCCLFLKTFGRDYSSVRRKKKKSDDSALPRGMAGYGSPNPGRRKFDTILAKTRFHWVRKNKRRMNTPDAIGRPWRSFGFREIRDPHTNRAATLLGGRAGNVKMDRGVSCVT